MNSRVRCIILKNIKQENGTDTTPKYILENTHLFINNA